MKLFIYSLEKTLFEGEAEAVQVPSVDGELGILNGHIPLITALKTGTVRVAHADAAPLAIPVSGGYLEVGKNRVVLLVR
ncbi:MAG: F-type H+-transporting ATPase subunit epsilon [Parcubacteria group bacterium Gr01-1014_72]|nr:MAG: F-type H+-transporting ATPase subunit epsilon [Parcubacteria group bacterium Gr01-1014_72]